MRLDTGGIQQTDNLEFQLLRVLDLHNLRIETLPSSIGGLVHLRYLDLSENPVTELPASITQLQNLQTLKLNRCWKLKVLPADVKKLINLRHLDLGGHDGLGSCLDLASMPAGMGRLIALHKLDVFIVGIDHRASVSETKTARLRDLKALDKLSGRLRIKILGEMKYPVNEAKEANLSSKHGLSELLLEGKHDEAVLDGLQPPRNLRKLAIRDYRGQRLPTWASMDSLNCSIPNLVVVELEDWGSCLNVPLFSRLRSLKRLRLYSLKSVEYMENSRYDASSSSSSTSFFPSLEELQLWDMDKLKSWWWMEAGAAVDAGQRTSSSTSSTEVQPQHIQPSFFPRLLKLEIGGCPSPKSIPLCPNVEELQLVRVNKELRVLTTVVMPREGASRLKTMRIADIGGLISLPTDCLRGLTSLTIGDSKLLDLSSLAEVFRSLSSLESLRIHGCNGLRSLHGGLEHLSSFKKMEIQFCEQLDLSAEDKEIGMPWKALKGLQSLMLDSIPKVLVLPDGLQHLTALRLLYIMFNYELMTIPEWINCLGSLELLQITYCPKVKTLPEGIRFLTSLKNFDIYGCSGLTERCRGPNGDDWPKIQHIPKVSV
ncbi:hypothetical protein Droror1_Dr00011311 [Drosera rotundifolia]